MNGIFRYYSDDNDEEDDKVHFVYFSFSQIHWFFPTFYCEKFQTYLYDLP